MSPPFRVASCAPMSENTAPATQSEQPANDEVTTALASEQPQGDATALFKSLSEDQQNRILYPDEYEGEPEPEPAEPQAAEPVKAEPAAKPEEPEEPDTETAEPEGKEQPEPEATDTEEPIKRVSTRSLEREESIRISDAIQMVKEGKAKSFNEAYRKLSPEEEPAQPVPAPEERQPVAEAPQTYPAVEALSNELTQLRAQRKEAMANFEHETSADLTDQIEDKIAEIVEAKATARQQAEASKQIQAEWQKSVTEVEAKYQELNDDASPMSRLLDGLVQGEIARGKNPDLRALAEEAATILKVSTKTAPTTTAAPKPNPAPAPPLRTKANGSAVAAGHTQAGSITEAEASRYINSGDLDSIDLDDF